MNRKGLLLLLTAMVLPVMLRGGVLDNWTTNQITTNSYGFKQVVYGNGRYVAVGDEGPNNPAAIYSSEDGFNWVLRYTDNNCWSLSLTYSGGHFVGVGVGGLETAISANGTNWTVSSLPSQYGNFGNVYNGYPGDMTCGGGIFVVVGSTNSVGTIITSPDGATWTPQTVTPVGGFISSVACNGSQFVAVGNNDGNEYTASLSGTGWIRNSIPGGNLVSYANGLYLVPLNSGTNLISTDGFNWSLLPTGLTNQLGKVIYADRLFIARSGSYLATSTDGTNWIQPASPIPGNSALATAGNRLVAVSYRSSGIRFSNGDNSFVYNSPLLVNLGLTNSPARKLALAGLIGATYQIRYASTLTGANNWQTNLTIQLTNTPYLWADPAATNSARFYRGVLLP